MKVAKLWQTKTKNKNEWGHNIGTDTPKESDHHLPHE